MPMMPIATAHEITSPTICMAFLNLKTAKALGHNHCCPAPMWRSNSASFCCIAECPLLAQSRHGLLHCTCLLLGAKRTFCSRSNLTLVSQSDKFRTSVVLSLSEGVACVGEISSRRLLAL